MGGGGHCLSREGSHQNLEDCMLEEMLELFEDEADEILLDGVCKCKNNPPDSSFVGKYSKEANKRMMNKLFDSPRHEEL